MAGFDAGGADNEHGWAPLGEAGLEAVTLETRLDGCRHLELAKTVDDGVGKLVGDEDAQIYPPHAGRITSEPLVRFFGGRVLEE